MSETNEPKEESLIHLAHTMRGAARTLMEMETSILADAVAALEATHPKMRKACRNLQKLLTRRAQALQILRDADGLDKTVKILNKLREKRGEGPIASEQPAPSNGASETVASAEDLLRAARVDAGIPVDDSDDDDDESVNSDHD